ncbi:MAG: hypothetical protein VYB50_04570 [Candidatus Thermoplasmatota archaeon]|nr:hypothetical protein [Candidatus Thermoplasmatota archaeon]
MVSQPGVSDVASECLERMKGQARDENGEVIHGKNNPHAPFKSQTEAYRFAAMVGHRLDRRTENEPMQTKWATTSITKDVDFEALFSYTGRDLDYVDWVDAMNRCADWGAKYIDAYHKVDDEYTLGYLIEILTTDDEIDECTHCSVWRKTSDESCWFCKS